MGFIRRRIRRARRRAFIAGAAVGAAGTKENSKRGKEGFCTKCGVKLGPESKFCAQCGAPRE